MVRSIAQSLGFPLVNLPATATTSETVIRFLVQHLAHLGHIPPDRVGQAIDQALSLEGERSSFLARDVALPRSRCDVDKIAAIIGLSPDGIAWQGPAGQPVHTICLVVAPWRRPAAYLRFLANTVKVLQSARSSVQLPAVRERAARS
jgi:mannitol/fructose-specific phosphotransferase system IIA component (Ntr-type)